MKRSDGVSLDGVAGQGFLGRLAPDVVQDLIRSSRSASYPGGTILSPSRDGTGPAVVVSGRLRYFLSAPDGRELTLRYLAPGDLVGTVIRDQSRAATRVEVLSDAVLLHLDEVHMRSLAARRPELAEALLGEVTARLRAAYARLAARAFSDVRSRVARDLIERAEMCGPVQPGAHVNVTQQSLADATGTVREVVARAVREMRREGLVASNGEGITVLDPERLTRVAGL